MKANLLRFHTLALAAVLSVLAGPAFAQAPATPTIDYDAAISGGRDELIGALATSIGPILLMIAVVAAISWAVKMFRRAVKSS